MIVRMIGPGKKNRLRAYTDCDLFPTEILDMIEDFEKRGWKRCGWWQYFLKGIFPIFG